jgi:RNA polymerase sigma-70 factor (ECF subfamily)
MALERPTGSTVFDVVVKPSDHEAWTRFVVRYGPLIQCWCRAWHLQEADAEEVIQIVLVKLFRNIGRFERNGAGSFRAFLRTVSHNTVCDVLNANKRLRRLVGDPSAFTELPKRLDGEYDHEFLEEACARVKRRVEEKTWAAFRLTACEDFSGADVAKRLGMNRAAVFVAKYRVAQMIRQEIARLEDKGPVE